MERVALQKLSYGMYIVGSKKEDKIHDVKINAQMANSVFQVTSEPPQIAIAINKENLTHEFIKSSNVFSVSVLSKDAPIEFVGNFGFKSGRNADKFKELMNGFDYQKGAVTGSPLVFKNTVAVLEAEVVGSADLGTHTLFVGKIVAMQKLNDKDPLTYDEYRLVKKGYTPAPAPTYNPDAKIVP